MNKDCPNSAIPYLAINSWVGTEIIQSMNWFASSLWISGLFAGLTAITVLV
jgi:hypothetical protein